MSTTLAELRKRLLEKENKEQQSSNDNAIYAFWNIPEDSTAQIRFLPDGDASNDFFWVERQMIKLTFPGVVGQNTNKEVTVQVPCMEMWGDVCPILTEIRPWFKEADLEDVARKYWKKRSYIFQGFVREDPLDEKDSPENPIRRFVINTTVYKIIYNALMDPEMEIIPTDYHAGTDFKLVKTKQGNFPSYNTSNYARKSGPLTDEEIAAIETYGLFNLKDFLPKKPDADGVQAIKEMFEASYNGELYDPERWAQYYKPYGLNFDTENKSPSTTTTSAPKAEKPTQRPVKVDEPEVEDDDSNATAPWEDSNEPVAAESKPAQPASVSADADSSDAKRSPQDIIAQIKARREAKGQ